MKKRQNVLVLLGICVVLILAALTLVMACAEEEAPRKVKVGWLAPLSGPAAMYGLPGRTGLNIWLDEVNAAGGIEVGGKKYLVEMVEYDDEGVPSNSVMGARKLVLEDEVKAIFGFCGAEISAIQAFINEQKMLTFSVVAYDAGPDRPYTICTGEGAPYYTAMGVQYICDHHPEVKRVAVIGQDDEIGKIHYAWSLAAWDINNVEPVWAKMYSLDTVDFAPMVSSIMATEPDFVSLSLAYPEFQSLIVEQLYLQGYTGMLETTEWDTAGIYAKVPQGYLEGAIGYNPTVLDDPRLCPRTLEWYKEWMRRYGPGAPEDVHRSLFTTDYYFVPEAWAWQYGVELADSFDPTAVRDALLAAEEVPHIFGPARWGGEDIWGCMTALVQMQFISEIQGTIAVPIELSDPLAWYREGNHKEVVLSYMEKEGLLYWQR